MPTMNEPARSPAGPAPLRAIAYAPPDVRREQAADGSTRLTAAPLGTYDPSLARLFRAAVERQPQRIFLAERVEGNWRTLTYADARARVDAIAAALLARGLSPHRPALILAGNSIDHALLMLAGYTAGVPVAAASVAYSLQSQDFGKLKHIADLLTPGMIYVSDTGPFAKALAAIDHSRAEIVATRNSANLPGATAFEQLTATSAGPEVERAVAATGADTIAKFLFTSGSTGLPKGVVNTHGMLTANQQALAQIWPFCA